MTGTGAPEATGENGVTGPAGATTEQARQFLAAVEASCADLPAADRARLLGGLEEHLAELAADGVDLVGELGDPAAYARELRSAAGLPTGGPATMALPLGPPTTALPLGSPGGPWPATGPAAGQVGAPARPGRGVGKVLLVVAAVLAGVGLLLVALLVGGVFLFGVSSSGSSAPSVQEAPLPATSVVITTPDVVGLTADEARAVLENAGLVTGSLQVSSTPKPAGSGGNVVVAQEPVAGSAVAPGSTVTLTITNG